ncbi:MAG: ATP-binding protein [Actinomycetota bacterium]|nr:ATP-binding protein [Actinomycetota bacterium]
MGHTDSTEFRLELSAGPDAPRAARRFVVEHAEILPPELIEDAELLVSELVSNAVRYGRPAIMVIITLEPPLVGVSVRDEGEMIPSASPTSVPTSAVSGRGLVIVDRLSSAWGVTPADPPPGKTVWFRLDAGES